MNESFGLERSRAMTNLCQISFIRTLCVKEIPDSLNRWPRLIHEELIRTKKHSGEFILADCWQPSEIGQGRGCLIVQSHFKATTLNSDFQLCAMFVIKQPAWWINYPTSWHISEMNLRRWWMQLIVSSLPKEIAPRWIARNFSEMCIKAMGLLSHTERQPQSCVMTPWVVCTATLAWVIFVRKLHWNSILVCRYIMDGAWRANNRHLPMIFPKNKFTRTIMRGYWS